MTGERLLSGHYQSAAYGFYGGCCFLNKGRKMGFLVCAIFALPVMLVPHIDNMWLAVALIAIAAGGHCGWSANIFSLMSDIFPRKVTASITGIGGFAGAVGGLSLIHISEPTRLGMISYAVF